MNNTVLQIPVDKNVRNQAASKAEKMGFSSLQEVVRLFLNKIASGKIDVTFEPTVKLSTKATKKYNKIIDEIESGKAQTKSFTDVKNLMKYLNEG
ncbi:type II toxin-antitoxin system RelB/DinJ family antitoxin [Candidatus Daviesbacteria bacterium]|nr:type II toxin-antitoxin system RelB/DinJ family antitoxin [Candidatus Daviesbacteria bacterium]